MNQQTDREYILARIDIDAAGCWVWRLSTDRYGYGKCTEQRLQSQLAHRLSYLTFVGPIQDGRTLDHLCAVHNCVNPEHLEPVTRGENNRRGKQIGYGPNAPRTCKNGHDWSELPPYIVRQSNGKIQRRCRACHRVWCAATYRRRIGAGEQP